MKLKYTLVIGIAFLFGGILSAQNNYSYEKTFAGYKSYLSNEFGVSCKAPKKFTNLDKYFVLFKIRKDKDKHTGSIYGPLFLSRDKQCIVLYGALPRDFSKGGKESTMSHPAYPRSQITAEIKTALGLFYSGGNPKNNDSTTFNFNDYVTTITGHKARAMFNADVIYKYDFPGADSVYFIDDSLEKLRHEKYPFCTGVFITKNNRATMDVKLLFTKEGKQHEKKYVDLLREQIWYEDDFVKGEK